MPAAQFEGKNDSQKIELPKIQEIDQKSSPEQSNQHIKKKQEIQNPSII